MATLFTDSFDRANSSNLGANWTEISGDLSIVSNGLNNGTVTTNPAVAETTTAAHAATADVAVSLTQVVTTSDGGPMARSNSTAPVNTTGTNAGASYSIDCSGTVSDINRYDPGVGVTLLRTTTVTKSANAVMRLEVTGSGAVVTVKQFYNGVQQGADVSDGDAARITTAGRTGVLGWNSASGLPDWNDFLAEDLVVAPPLSANAPAFLKKRVPLQQRLDD